MFKRDYHFALTCLTLCACGDPAPSHPTITVDRGDLIFERHFYGELEARKSIAIHVPEVSGVWQFTVASVLEDGTEVKEGQTVLTFDNTIFEDELQELQNQLAVARAELRRVAEAHDREKVDLQLNEQRSKLEVERAQLNVVTGVNLVSKLELEKAKIALNKSKLELSLAQKALASFAKKRKSALDVQRLKVAAAEEKVREKQQHLAQSEIKAPADGVIYAPYTRLNWVRGKVDSGSVTRPGDKLLEIPDLSSFNAVIYVRQRDATILKEGDRATVYPTVLPDQAIGAKVIKRESFATTRNERLGTEDPAGNLKEVRVVLELDKSLKELRPGGSVRAELRSVIAKNVLRLPLSALIKDNGSYQVDLEDGSKQKVKIGKITPVYAQILGGIGEGTEVRLPQSAP
jgi:multidrug resistance efflux pump